MKLLNFKEIIDHIERHAPRVVETSFENWPPSLTRHVLAAPVVSVAIPPGQLARWLAENASYKANVRQAPTARRSGPEFEPLELPKGQRFFPKIGPVSFKEIPAFVDTSADEIDAVLPMMTRSLTDRMAAILHAFVFEGVATDLHFYPLQDFTQIGEARFQIDEAGEIRSARWISSGTLERTKQMNVALYDYGMEVANASGLSDCLLDISIQADGEETRYNVLEINPALPDFVGAH